MRLSFLKFNPFAASNPVLMPRHPDDVSFEKFAFSVGERRILLKDIWRVIANKDGSSPQVPLYSAVVKVMERNNDGGYMHFPDDDPCVSAMVSTCNVTFPETETEKVETLIRTMQAMEVPIVWQDMNDEDFRKNLYRLGDHYFNRIFKM